MKKMFFALLALILASGAAFAVEGAVINIKAGLDTAGNMSASRDGNGNKRVKVGISLTGEYLFKMNDIVKLGGGMEYLLPRDFDTEFAPSFSFLPIYLSAEITPIPPLRELYFKGNIGYNVLFDYDYELLKFDEKGGMYFAIGAGYVFDFGLFLETLYGFYYGSLSGGLLDIGVAYTKLGFNAGYRFNI